MKKLPISPFKVCVDVSRLISVSLEINEALLQICQTIVHGMLVNLCSIYLYSSKEDVLILKAGIDGEGKPISLQKYPSSEGLVGLVFSSSKLIQIKEIESHPRFKHFPQMDEMGYTSFVGLPLIEQQKTFGVLVVRTHQKRIFPKSDEDLLTVLASQLTSFVSKSLISNHRISSSPLLSQLSEKKRIDGHPIAPGVALQQAVILHRHVLVEPLRQTSRTVEQELRGFLYALEQTIADTTTLVDQVSQQISPHDAAIFRVHLMFLEDRGLQQKIRTYIDEGNTASWSIYQVVQEYLKSFDLIDDIYFKERGNDLRDVGYRLLQHLGHGQTASFQREGILVAKQLLPGDVARLDPQKVKGIITSTGAAVSHASILARSLLIPAICVTESELESLQDGDLIAMDGQAGYIVVNPRRQITEEFRRLLAEQKLQLNQLQALKETPCQTKEGCHISILANVGLLNEANQLQSILVEGIGLYRSEVYFMSLNQYPSIEDQVAVYTKVIQSVLPQHPVVIRTLDLGGDKVASYMKQVKEDNPALGERGIRKQLADVSMLKQQIHAVLLAAAGSSHQVYLLFPMITQKEELETIKRLHLDCVEELQLEGHLVHPVGIGAMLEIPASILLCEHIVPEVDFLAIGTNDLTQYTLAVDRTNPKVANLYDPLHPAVLRLIQRVVLCSQHHQKILEVCGEMASDPDGCVVLVGLGLRHLSMNIGVIPVVKKRLSLITLAEAESLAQAALQFSSATEVRKHITHFFDTLSPSPRL